MATVNTIQNTLNWASAFILNRPSVNVAGNFQEPGLTNANLIMSSILSPPFAWQWNRAEKTFPTVIGTADYSVSISDFGWLEKATRFNAGTSPTIVEIPIVPVLATSGDQDPPFQIAVQQDDNANNIKFRLLAIPDAVYTITLIYQKAPIFATSLYGTQLVLTAAGNASAGTTVYTGTITGGSANALANQSFQVAGFVTNVVNNGLYLATASSATNITLQNPNGVSETHAATASPATTWAPIPDKYNFLYERGMLAHLHAMYDAATYGMELQLFFRQLVGCSQGLSDTAKAIFLEDKLAQIRTEAAAMAGSSASPKRGQ